MKVNGIDVQKSIDKIKLAIVKDSSISTLLKNMIDVLITVINFLLGQVSLNSSNSSKPPSTDINKLKKKERKKSTKKQGGQPGHLGKTLMQVKDPDKIITINIDKNKLPPNKTFRKGEEIVRQVVNIKISKTVVEYRVEVLIDENGKKYFADFPRGVTQPIQYGNSVKEHSCFLSTYQLIPYGRISAQFGDQYDIPISTGSIYNFNNEAAKKLEKLGFDRKVKEQLINS